MPLNGLKILTSLLGTCFHQIREAMEKEEHKKTFEAVVEIDETYVGGKPRKNNNCSNDEDNKPKRGRGTSKTPVIGVLDVLLAKFMRL